MVDNGYVTEVIIDKRYRYSVSLKSFCSSAMFQSSFHMPELPPGSYSAIRIGNRYVTEVILLKCHVPEQLERDEKIV